MFMGGGGDHLLPSRRPRLRSPFIKKNALECKVQARQSNDVRSVAKGVVLL